MLSGRLIIDGSAREIAELEQGRALIAVTEVEAHASDELRALKEKPLLIEAAGSHLLAKAGRDGALVCVYIPNRQERDNDGSSQQQHAAERG